VQFADGAPLPVEYLGTTVESVKTVVVPLASDVSAIPSPAAKGERELIARRSVTPLTSHTLLVYVAVARGSESAGNADTPVAVVQPEQVIVAAPLWPTVSTPAELT